MVAVLHAQIAGASQGHLGLLFAVAVAAVLALGAAVMVARAFWRRSLKPAEEEAFSMDKLQALRDSGQISQEEFARLRAAAMGLSDPGRKDYRKSSGGMELDDGTEGATSA